MPVFSKITKNGKILQGIEPQQHGIIIGKTVTDGKETIFWIEEDVRKMPMVVIGSNSSDRLNFLKQMIRQDIKNRKPLCIIDTDGSLVQDALETIGKERAEDVIIFDPTDIARPVSINILEEMGEHPEKSKQLSGLVVQVFKEYLSVMYPQTEKANYLNNFSKYMQNSLLDTTFLKDVIEELPRSSLLELFSILESLLFMKVVEESGEKITSKNAPYLTNKFLTGKTNQKGMRTYWEFLRAIGELLTNKVITNIVGAEKSSFDIRRTLTEGKVLIGNFSNTIHQYRSFLINILLIKLLAAVDKISHIYINDFTRILPGLLKSPLYSKMILSGNFLIKIKDAFPKDINRVYFSANSKTVEADEEIIGPKDIRDIPKGDFIMMVGALKKQMKLIPLLPQKTSLEVVKATKELLRLKYGQSAEVVERMISLRAEKYLQEGRDRKNERELANAALKLKMAFFLDTTNYRIPRELAEMFGEEGKKLLNEGSTEEANECFKSAIIWYKNALSLFSKSADLHNMLGSLYEEVKDFPNAIEHYQEAIKTDHEYRWAYANLASVYGEQGEEEKAITILKKVLSIKPDYVAAIQRLARFYRTRFPDKTHKLVYKMQKELSGETLYYVGESLYNQGKYQEGVALSKEWISKAPTRWGYKVLAEGYLQMQQFDKAIESYKKGFEVVDKDKNKKKYFLQDIAIVYRLKGEFKKALELVQEGLESDPESKYLLSTCALTYLSAGKYEKALETWNGILKDAPPDDDWINKNKDWIFANIGFCHYKMGNLKEAEKRAKDALKIGKMGYTWPNFTMGFIQLAKREKSLAKHYFSKGIGLITSIKDIDEPLNTRKVESVTPWLNEVIQESSDNLEAKQILSFIKKSAEKIKKKLPGYHLWRLEIHRNGDKFLFKLSNEYLDLMLSKSLTIPVDTQREITVGVDELYSQQFKDSTAYLNKVKEIGKLIFGKALSQEMGKYLMRIPGEYLEIVTEEVKIPWELAFDGNKFLGFVHSVGRNGKTRPTSSSNIKKKVLNILTISDNEDLAKDIDNLPPVREKSWRQVFFNSDKEWRSVLLDILVTTKFDIINFVGNVQKQIEDENLLPILKNKTPHVVFIDTDNSVSLANSFLNVGVNVFIGRAGKISQNKFPLSFLRQLTIEPCTATALKEAKILDCLQIDGSGTNWASYLLFGDPAFTISPQSSKR